MNVYVYMHARVCVCVCVCACVHVCVCVHPFEIASVWKLPFCNDSKLTSNLPSCFLLLQGLFNKLFFTLTKKKHNNSFQFQCMYNITPQAHAYMLHTSWNSVLCCFQNWWLNVHNSCCNLCNSLSWMYIIHNWYTKVMVIDVNSLFLILAVVGRPRDAPVRNNDQLWYS